ncbi:uncharacterized protein [Parasteatoda tepidariorum]|nr:uncharacterized protein LOC107443189 isoform X2 [Parasteatoda tepidariorum]
MMQPILNEVRYMFPTTQLEIEGMCQVWSHIMDCIRKYVIDCSSEEQRTKFNEAVSNSIDSVHAICSSERYRRDYLEYATCYRKVSMDSCGNHFKKMVDSAYNPHSSEVQICCAYRQYEKCVSDPIQRMCGPQALHILDDSMSSLKSRCDAVSQSLKSKDKICQMETPVQDTQEYQARPALRHIDQSFGPLSTSAFLLNSRAVSYTTPAWTPRTVIYPLPVTRHSSRISRSNGLNLESSICFTLVCVLAHFAMITAARILDKNQL